MKATVIAGLALLISLSSLTCFASLGSDKLVLQDQLLEYIQAGDLNNVELLLTKKASVNDTNTNELTPLRVAVLFDHYKITELLLKVGAVVNTVNRRDGCTPLHDAVYKGNANLIKLLLDYSADVTLKNHARHTPLQEAKKKQDTAITDLLKKANTKAKRRENKKRKSCKTLSKVGTLTLPQAQKKVKKVEKDEAGDQRFEMLVAATLQAQKIDGDAQQEVVDKLGSTSLLEAASNGNTKAVDFLIKKGANLEVVDKNSLTPLHVAAYNGHTETAALLINKRANLEAADNQGFTPLHMAVYNGCTKTVELLIKKRANLGAMTERGETPIQFAKSKNHKAIFEMLLGVQRKYDEQLFKAVHGGTYEEVKRLLEVGANLGAVTKGDRTPLHVAAFVGKAEVVALLIERGAQREAVDKNSWTPLHIAAFTGKTEVVALLIEKGAHLKAVDKNSKTPLQVAADKGYKEIVEMLLAAQCKYDEQLFKATQDSNSEEIKRLCEAGANLEAVNKVFDLTPLQWAAYNGRMEIAPLLIDKGAHLETVSKSGYTPLHQAVRKGHTAMVAFLIGKGAKLEAVTASCWTLLHVAASNGRTEIINVLIEKGANLEAVDKNGWTPLQLAAFGGHTKTVKLLLERCAKAETIDNYNATPLHVAAFNGHTEIVGLLIEKGASLETVAKKYCWTPLHMATFNGKAEVVALLIEKGANLKAVDKNGKTPLQLAQDKGHQKVVEMLTKEGIQLRSS